MAMIQRPDLPVGGGTLKGPLILASDPTAALQAVTKQYVDNGTIPFNIVTSDWRISQ